MAREITLHKLSGLNDALTVEAMFEPGPGGAHDCYVITASCPDGEPIRCQLEFQEGPIQENGVNGISNEALLAVLIDRLEGFQQGPFSCEENELALVHLEEALSLLKQRTLERIHRGVEGQLKP